MHRQGSVNCKVLCRCYLWWEGLEREGKVLKAEVPALPSAERKLPGNPLGIDHMSPTSIPKGSTLGVQKPLTLP